MSGLYKTCKGCVGGDPDDCPFISEHYKSIMNPNITNSGTVASEAVVEITMESLEASNHPEAKAILALIASKVREARIDELVSFMNRLDEQDPYTPLKTTPRGYVYENYIDRLATLKADTQEQSKGDV